MSTGALPGFRDFYPEQFAQRAWLFERWRDVARRFGFVEYDGPPLEPLDLYTRKSGDEIVGQLYNFEDKGGRQVALRPEMTPTVARMVAARANALRKPVRWFSIPQLFRYERQQKGRLREHFQLNVDIFGEADVAADAELLAVACGMMRNCQLGPADVVARVSDRRLLTALVRGAGIADAAIPAVFAAVDKIEREPQETLVRKMTDAGVAPSAAGRVLELVRTSDLELLRAEFANDGEVAAALARFDDYGALLEAHGVRDYFRLDLTIVRGLAYYTGIVFELFDARGEFRAVCGGGRYDNLLSAIGGADMPALGFGMGDVVLGELLTARREERNGIPPWAGDETDFWLGVAEGDDLVRATRDASTLRQIGCRVEVPLRRVSRSKQKKAARSSSSKFYLEPVDAVNGATRYRVTGALLAVSDGALPSLSRERPLTAAEIRDVVLKNPGLVDGNFVARMTRLDLQSGPHS
ncbi:MAG: ATP phosphoribosyltransferase regulatory subunit [Gemmatimonadaceae bacterium]|nr:ATP phosphoribosyltransferase regulatory subunit [Gemmatimonadaceae bacterium]